MITIKSHGFKFSRPEANIVFDVSFLKNPWRDPKIRNDKEKILESIREQFAAQDISLYIAGLLEQYNHYYPGENIQVAICCSAGEYRSPAVVIMVAEHLKARAVDCEIIQSPNSRI